MYSKHGCRDGKPSKYWNGHQVGQRGADAYRLKNPGRDRQHADGGCSRSAHALPNPSQRRRPPLRWLREQGCPPDQAGDSPKRHPQSNRSDVVWLSGKNETECHGPHMPWVNGAVEYAGQADHHHHTKSPFCRRWPPDNIGIAGSQNHTAEGWNPPCQAWP